MLYGHFVPLDWGFPSSPLQRDVQHSVMVSGFFLPCSAIKKQGKTKLSGKLDDRNKDKTW